MPAVPRCRPRRAAASVCLVALPLLAGCMSLDSSTTIVSDQEIHTLVDVGISDEVASTYGLDARTICGPFVTALPGGAVADPYVSNDSVHCRITATSTLAQMQAAPRSAMAITHADGTYDFSFSPNDAALGGVSLPGLTTGIDSVRVQVTFPGRVLHASSDAHVQDRTATWDQRGDITQTLSASGLDHTASARRHLLPWLAAASSLLLALIAAGVLLHERRHRASSTPPPTNGGPTEGGGTGATNAAPAGAEHTGSTGGGVPVGSHAWMPASSTPAAEGGATAAPTVPAPPGAEGTVPPDAKAPVLADAPQRQHAVPHETAPQPPVRPATPPPATPSVAPGTPRPAADPWGGRSPWQRPE